MDNLFMGNVVPPPSSGTSLPEVLSSVLRPVPTRRYRALWKSFRNLSGQRSDKPLKLTGLKSESLTDFIPES
jgi:hypothetical protein